MHAKPNERYTDIGTHADRQTDTEKKEGERKREKKRSLRQREREKRSKGLLYDFYFCCCYYILQHAAIGSCRQFHSTDIQSVKAWNERTKEGRNEKKRRRRRRRRRWWRREGK